MNEVANGIKEQAQGEIWRLLMTAKIHIGKDVHKECDGQCIRIPKETMIALNELGGVVGPETIREVVEKWLKKVISTQHKWASPKTNYTDIYAYSGIKTLRNKSEYFLGRGDDCLEDVAKMLTDNYIFHDDCRYERCFNLVPISALDIFKKSSSEVWMTIAVKTGTGDVYDEILEISAIRPWKGDDPDEFEVVLDNFNILKIERTEDKKCEISFTLAGEGSSFSSSSAKSCEIWVVFPQEITSF